MPGTWRHLTGRFFRVAVADGLNGDERAAVDRLLHPGEEALFDGQPGIDQRHGFEAMQRVRASHPDRVDLQRTALLHDVGKRHARLGVMGRVLATLVAKAHLPSRGRFRVYLDHGPIAAAELQQLGAETIVVEFTRHHHHGRPPQVSGPDWAVLQAADH